MSRLFGWSPRNWRRLVKWTACRVCTGVTGTAQQAQVRHQGLGAVLLGRNDFFNVYKVSFDNRAETFTLEPYE
jgi:hypothetical protein